jgi:hypothetical protein
VPRHGDKDFHFSPSHGGHPVVPLVPFGTIALNCPTTETGILQRGRRRAFARRLPAPAVRPGTAPRSHVGILNCTVNQRLLELLFFCCPYRCSYYHYPCHL